MKLIYVTERARIRGNAIDYLTRLLEGRPDALLIREKDLNDDALYAFVEPLVSLAARCNVPLILRGTPEQARQLGIRHLQLSFAEATSKSLPKGFDSIGVSVHSLAEALTAQRIGADRVTYGHIFTSPCKPGLPPRGLDALDELVRACKIPVYAIGGITKDTLPFLLPINPAGACLMSASMTDSNPETLTTRLRSILEQA
ncbi:MAG: thiamine phosphate synthase [Peptococcaceae bacterium]|nr:thiamine phosphate synthase [Peptococcaceae bacterium]